MEAVKEPDIGLNLNASKRTHKAGDKAWYKELQQLGVGAVHDASFMQQLDEGSQYGYALLLGPEAFFDEEKVVHLIDWSSSKIHRKVRSTLAAEAASASRAYDRAVYARAMIAEIEHERLKEWKDMVRSVPCSMCTDCKSLYDLCLKVGSMPDERRVALDLLDVREGMEELKDQIRWIPTQHMLADALTKTMPPDLFLKFMKDNKYAFKFAPEICAAKERAKERRRELKAEKKAAKEAARASPSK